MNGLWMAMITIDILLYGVMNGVMTVFTVQNIGLQ